MSQQDLPNKSGHVIIKVELRIVTRSPHKSRAFFHFLTSIAARFLVTSSCDTFLKKIEPSLEYTLEASFFIYFFFVEKLCIIFDVFHVSLIFFLIFVVFFFVLLIFCFVFIFPFLNVFHFSLIVVFSFFDVFYFSFFSFFDFFFG